MRITGGVHKGRKLQTLKGKDVRPSSSLLRESLFNILQEEIVDTSFLDLYAGAGSIGIEALSRQAKKVVFVEINATHAKIIAENLTSMSIPKEDYELIVSPVERYLRKKRHEQFDFIFLDPPYNLIDKNFIRETCLHVYKSEYLKTSGSLILEHSLAHEIESFHIEHFILDKNKKYGHSCLAFYKLV